MSKGKILQDISRLLEFFPGERWVFPDSSGNGPRSWKDHIGVFPVSRWTSLTYLNVLSNIRVGKFLSFNYFCSVLRK